MDSYLMMLYVTLEQEYALKVFFLEHGWTFCKPDLAVTTDKVGPAIFKHAVQKTVSHSSSSQNKKRKADEQAKAPVIKSIKVCSSTSKDNPKFSQVRTVSVKQQDLQKGTTETSEAKFLGCEGGDDNREVEVKVEVGTSDDLYYGDSCDDTDDYDDQVHMLDDANSLSASRSSADIPGLLGASRDVIKTGLLSTLLNQSMETKSANQGEFRCCICGQVTKNKSNLRRHLKIHLPNKINCSICNRFFNSNKEKEDHMIEKHAAGFKCDLCDVSFKRKFDLNAHLLKHKSKTDSDIPGCLRCPVENCKKIFFRLSNFKFHMNTHEGKKPFACSECDKSFSSAWNRNVHAKMCCSNTEFTCDLCQKVFKQKSGLYNHRQAEHVHSEEGFSCKSCACVFKYKTGLLRHMREKHQDLEVGQQNDSIDDVDSPLNVKQIKRELKDKSDDRMVENKACVGSMKDITDLSKDKPKRTKVGKESNVVSRVESKVVSRVELPVNKTESGTVSENSSVVLVMVDKHQVSQCVQLSTQTHSGASSNTPAPGGVYTIAHTGQRDSTDFNADMIW